MIDLMETGRRLWESGDTQRGGNPDQPRPAMDLMELGRQIWEEGAADADSPPTAVRHSSAPAQSSDSGPSAKPQYPQPPAPISEIEATITGLADAGRAVDARLAHRLRDVLAPMDRATRADLITAVDDALASTNDLDEANRRAMALLGDATARAPLRGAIGDRVPWIAWIAERCPLLAEDRTFICRRMRTLPPKAAERTAKRYVDTWRMAAEAEPSPVKQENAGRAAANRSLLALIR